MSQFEQLSIAVIIPAYKVTRHILSVIAEIGSEVNQVYVVDDCCPDGSGAFVTEHCRDPRVVVLRNEVNRGVGGAVMAGYRAAIDAGHDILVKVDGDGQMDPRLIPDFIAPIVLGNADYTKGNRFFDLETLRAMPGKRLFGNAVLSFMTKFSSGYWDLFDPTNGYTAIHARVAEHLPFDKISERYFFETDILFRLNLIGVVVVDVPMDAHYADEVSNLKISKIVGEFSLKHIRNSLKRIFYNYYLRGFSIASLELPLGILLFTFGVVYGGMHWIQSSASGEQSPAGTVMLAALPVLIGIQLILAFVGYDISHVPQKTLHRASLLKKREKR